MVLALSAVLPDLPDIDHRVRARFPHVWDRCLIRALLGHGGDHVLDCVLVARAVREYDREAAQILARADECHPAPIEWGHGARLMSVQFSLTRFVGNGWVHCSNRFPDAEHNRFSCLVTPTRTFFTSALGG